MNFQVRAHVLRSGNLPDLLRPDNAAEAEFAWIRTYGTALKIKGALGIDILFVADPKALHYILNTGGYHFPKPQQNLATSRIVTGEGIFFAQGAQHARHRKIMNPAFSYGALRVFLPMFRHTAQRTVAKWKGAIARSHGASESVVLNIPRWLALTALDALGATAFDYHFGALDEEGTELSELYMNLFADSFFKRTDFTIAFEALWGYLPLGLVKFIQMAPTRQLGRLRAYMKVARRVAKDIVDVQTETYSAGKEGGKDVMSILIRANLSEDTNTKLSEEEIMAQLTSLMLAGHDTTAITVTWALHELSKCPAFQDAIREEIKYTRAQAAKRGDGELSVADLDSMKLLLAALKETLRYHPILSVVNREAGRDDVIPLSEPVMTKTGEMLSSIPVRKGQRLVISVAAYNRRSVWGHDADVWRPERFLEDAELERKKKLGVIGNVATFSGGVRGCVGWRFAMIEMQAILIELLEHFEFSPAPGDREIIRGASGFVIPMYVRLPLFKRNFIIF
ncbi:PAH-inducible cytochrome P450 monooxygenase PC-PAH 1 [Gautieria morchelliformis]|nr:PAH-inducible cytochrome P450 monooxygenase PC-PAH 1 [Gautieria morchelliformis]